MGRLRNFVFYNNSFVFIVIGFFVLTGGAMAASPDVRAGIYDSSQQLVSVDNSYLLNLDVDTYQPQIQITGVTEDDTYYYVAYTIKTVDVQDGAWQDVTESKSMKIAKSDLNGQDLGVYVTGQLSQIVDAEKSRLGETQVLERQKGESQKIVATTYSGLVGKMFNPTENVLPGYVPVTSTTTAAVAINPPTVPDTHPVGAPSEQPFELPSSSSASALTVTVLGNNPVRVALGTAYTDLGAAASNVGTAAVTFSYQVDGAAVSKVAIDTTATSTHTIVYTAKDSSGNTGTATRTVIVYDPATTAPDATAPVITLNGASEMDLYENQVFTDPGATALDDVDGDVTSSITTTGSVDTATPGTYTITYWAQDSSGNRSSATRIVNVQPGSAPGSTATTTSDSSSGSTTSTTSSDTSGTTSTTTSTSTTSSTDTATTTSDTSATSTTASSTPTGSSSTATSTSTTTSTTTATSTSP